MLSNRQREPGKLEAAEAQPEETTVVQGQMKAAGQAQGITAAWEQRTAAAQELVAAAVQQEQVLAGLLDS